MEARWAKAVVYEAVVVKAAQADCLEGVDRATAKVDYKVVKEKVVVREE